MVEERVKPGRMRINLVLIREKLIEKYGKRCGYCGVELPFHQMLEVDEYIPLRVLGDPIKPLPYEYKEDNYVLSCSICNRIKGRKVPIADDGQVTILHPYMDNYNDVIVVNDKGEVEGRTKAAVSTIRELNLNRAELIKYRCANAANMIGKINDTSSAYDTYLDSKKQVASLLTISFHDDSQREYFNRMIYANVIGAMEAYLSKTLIGLVLNDERIFWKFIEKYDWNDEKVRIEDIKKTYDNLNIRVQTELTEILYHNLPKVKAIYLSVLAVDIWKDKTVMSSLCKAVDIRHDLVHRNGRKKSNAIKQEFHKITIEMINELIANVDKLVDCVEKQLKDEH